MSEKYPAPKIPLEEALARANKTFDRAQEIASPIECEVLPGHASESLGQPVMVFRCPCGMCPTTGLSGYVEGKHDKYWCRHQNKLYRIVQEG